MVRNFLVSFILIVIAVSPALATYPFDVIPADKYAHMFGCAFLVEAAKNRQWRGEDAAAVVLSAGMLKECYDHFWAKSEFSWSDIGFNVLGIGLGLII